jgi:hypothetical protein
MAKARRLAGEDDVGPNRQLQAAAEAQALNGSDRRNREALESVERRQAVFEQGPQFAGAQVRPRHDVAAEAEIRTLGVQEHCASRCSRQHRGPRPARRASVASAGCGGLAASKSRLHPCCDKRPLAWIVTDDQLAPKGLAAELGAFVLGEGALQGGDAIRRDPPKALLIAADVRHLRDDGAQPPLPGAEHDGMVAGVAGSSNTDPAGVDLRQGFQIGDRASPIGDLPPGVDVTARGVVLTRVFAAAL